MSYNFSRRYFFYGSLLAGAIPKGGWGATPSLSGAGYKSPNEKLNIASIGAGGKASRAISMAAANKNIVASLRCRRRASRRDIQEVSRRSEVQRLPQDARRAGGKDIDACIVTIPDFMHATAAIACMERGKHVYVRRSRWSTR